MKQKPKYRHQFEEEVRLSKSAGERTDFRSSRSQMFFKIPVLKDFANSTGKHPSWNQRLQHACFPVKFLKCLKALFFTEHLQWLLRRHNSYFQRSQEQKPVRLPAINNSFS